MHYFQRVLCLFAKAIRLTFDCQRDLHTTLHTAYNKMGIKSKWGRQGYIHDLGMAWLGLLWIGNGTHFHCELWNHYLDLLWLVNDKFQMLWNVNGYSYLLSTVNYNLYLLWTLKTFSCYENILKPGILWLFFSVNQEWQFSLPHQMLTQSCQK